MGYFSTPSGKIYDPDQNEVHLHEKYSKKYEEPYLVFKRLNCTVFAHRFIGYELFGKKIFKKGICVRHLDGNSTNNTHSNLKPGTHAQNMMDRPKEIRVKVATIASRKANPRTIEERLEIYEGLCQGMSYNALGRKFGVSKGTLSYIKNHSKEFKDYVQGKTKSIKENN